jgi:hypothetical protein
MMRKGRHDEGRWGSWIDGGQVSFRNERKERKTNKNKNKETTEGKEGKEGKANKRNRNKHRQKRKADKTSECLNTASRIFQRTSAQIVERRRRMKFY